MFLLCNRRWKSDFSYVQKDFVSAILFLTTRRWQMIYFLLAIYSAVFMSFIQVAGECFPVKKSFLFRFSECNFCQKTLAFYHIIPVFSFLFFRGKSRCCERPIPIIYFLMELVTPIYILLLYIQFSFSYSFLLYYIIYFF